jgi:hypothetical protein
LLCVKVSALTRHMAADQGFNVAILLREGAGTG